MNYILVVDDEKGVRDIIKFFLELFDYKVMVACNGEEGLKFFSEHCFDLVITDIRMPIMDGNKFAKAIRNSIRPDTPIIAISAYFGIQSVEKNLFDSIVDKPFELKSLGKIISQHLES